MLLPARLITAILKPKLVFSELAGIFKYLSFRMRYGFLNKIAPDPAGARRALVVSMTHHAPYAAWEGMLLLSLRLKGLTPVVLTERNSRWAIRTFRVFGIKHFIFMDDLSESTRGEADHKQVDRMISGPLAFGNLVGFKYRGVMCGRWALSTLSRKLGNKGLDLGDAGSREILKRAFNNSILAVHAAEKLFSEYKFEVILFHEKGYTPFGELFNCSVLKGCNVIQHTYGQKEKSFVLKRYNPQNLTFHPSSLSKASWEAVKRMEWSREQEHKFLEDVRDSYEKGEWFNRKQLLKGKSLKTPDEVRAELKMRAGRKVAMIFSHVLWDASFFFGESIFDDYEVWLIETVKAACANDNVEWYIKLHPDYAWKMIGMGGGADPRDILAIDSKVGKLPDHIHLIRPETPISTYSFFPVIDYAITVRGTVGIEAACFGVPVFTAGTGRYSGFGFTIDSVSREEYLDRMSRIQEYPRLSGEQIALARKHAYVLFDRRLFTFDSFDVTRRPSKRGLETVVKINVRSIGGAERSQDLKKFGDWAIDSRSEDYLEL